MSPFLLSNLLEIFRLFSLKSARLAQDLGSFKGKSAEVVGTYVYQVIHAEGAKLALVFQYSARALPIMIVGGVAPGVVKSASRLVKP